MVVMRTVACLALAVFVLACYAEWNFNLAPEAHAYQSEYPDAIRSGIDISYGFANLFLAFGAIAGFVGVVLVCFAKRSGLVPLIASAPAIAFGALLLAPQSNYPSVEPTYVLLLWCGASALWGSALVLAFTFLKA